MTGSIGVALEAPDMASRVTKLHVKRLFVGLNEMKWTLAGWVTNTSKDKEVTELTLYYDVKLLNLGFKPEQEKYLDFDHFYPIVGSAGKGPLKPGETRFFHVHFRDTVSDVAVAQRSAKIGGEKLWSVAEPK